MYIYCMISFRFHSNLLINDNQVETIWHRAASGSGVNCHLSHNQFTAGRTKLCRKNIQSLQS